MTIYKFPASFTQSRVVLTLLFLFPLLGNSVRSWTGSIFLLIFVASLFVKPWQRVSLRGWERIISVAMPVAMFFMLLISCLFNGWTDEQTKGAAVFSRFLMFTGVYFLLRTEPQGPLAFAYGCVLAAFLLVLQGANDILILGLERAYGVYGSPGLFAGQAFVFGLVCSLFARESRSRPGAVIFGLGVTAAIVALLMSGSRSTFFAIFLMSAFYLFSARGKIHQSLSVLAIIFLLGVAYLTVPSFGSQIDRSYQEVKSYITDRNVLSSSTHESVGTRFELWRVGLLIAKDEPLIGVGWRNFSSATPNYVREGLANPAVLGHRHPHNTYIEFLVNSGVLGLSLLTMWGFALRYYSKLNLFGENSNQSIWLRLYLGYLAAAGVNEGGLFIYGNSLSFYLMVLAVLLSTLHRAEFENHHNA